MQLLYDKGFIDTTKPPFHNDRELRACCLSCELYAGVEHDFRECDTCPVLALYEKWAKLYYRDWHNSWARGTFQNGW